MNERRAMREQKETEGDFETKTTHKSSASAEAIAENDVCLLTAASLDLVHVRLDASDVRRG